MLQEYTPEELPSFDNDEELRGELRELFPTDDPVLAYTATLADLEEGHRVLDIGCGDGALTFYEKLKIGRSGYIAGVDIDRESIEEAQCYANYLDMQIDFRVANLTSVPFADNFFDVITSSFVIHHLPCERKILGFREAFRVLRPGGRFFMADYGPGKGLYRWLAPLVVRLLFFVEEAKHAGDNVRGSIPRLMIDAGFDNVTIVDNLAMRYLTVDFISGRKPVTGWKVKVDDRIQ